MTSSYIMLPQITKKYTSITPLLVELETSPKCHCVCSAMTHRLICFLSRRIGWYAAFQDTSTDMQHDLPGSFIRSVHLTWPEVRITNWPFTFDLKICICIDFSCNITCTIFHVTCNIRIIFHHFVEKWHLLPFDNHKRLTPFFNLIQRLFNLLAAAMRSRRRSCLCLNLSRGRTGSRKHNLPRAVVGAGTDVFSGSRVRAEAVQNLP